MKRIIILIATLISVAANAATMESARCTDTPDSLGTDVAVGRTKWTFKCFPAVRGMMPGGKVELKDAQTGGLHLGYPTFGLVDEQGNVTEFWSAPVDESASCEMPKPYQLIGFCRAGCYTPDQMLLFSDTFQDIQSAKNEGRMDIVTVSPNSTLDDINFMENTLKSYTVDPEAKAQTILVIRTESGGELKVTTNHPLVVSTGDMKEAFELKVGDQLIHMDGSFDAISKIESFEYYGKVYNVEMPTFDRKENLVVAQGYLNGSVMYQNATVKEINRGIFRTLLPDGLLE